VVYAVTSSNYTASNYDHKPYMVVIIVTFVYTNMKSTDLSYRNYILFLLPRANTNDKENQTNQTVCLFLKYKYLYTCSKVFVIGYSIYQIPPH
jgi:hypothetical protein